MFDEIVKLLWMLSHMLRHVGLAIVSMLGAKYVINWAIQLNDPVVAALSTTGYFVIIIVINLAYMVYWTTLMDDSPERLEVLPVLIEAEKGKTA